MSKRANNRRCHAYAAALVLSVLLSGCGSVTVDLATAAPADTEVEQVVIELVGLEFLADGGDTETLEFNDAELVDLMDYFNGDPLRLFTTEQLPEGTYTGVRLLLAEDDAAYVMTDGAEYSLAYIEGDYVEIDLTATESEVSSESLTLTLDLRQSLSFDDDEDEYVLTPVLRSAHTEEAAHIAGSVTVDCPSGSSLSQGGAVYLFDGADTVDDIGNDGTEPYATTRVALDTSSGQFAYTLRYLPPGDYTIALTCQGDEDDPALDDDLEFGSSEYLELDANSTLTHDIAS